jgi:hypothetical protein
MFFASDSFLMTVAYKDGWLVSRQLWLRVGRRLAGCPLGAALSHPVGLLTAALDVLTSDKSCYALACFTKTASCFLGPVLGLRRCRCCGIMVNQQEYRTSVQ